MICESMIAMYYPEDSMKGRITNGSQRLIITTSPEEHRRVKLAQRRHKAGQRRTIQATILFLNH